ncbi:MAG: hypothetical protein KDD44_09530, partial [Bdellovibrionales bacterium]|nr:hypothetical protein [Bdellovibrionales bacterium]
MIDAPLAHSGVLGRLRADRLVVLNRYLLIALAATVGLSIAASQIAAIAAVVFWAAALMLSPARLQTAYGDGSRALLRPLAGWILISFLASIVGVHFLRSISEVIKTTIYLMLPFVVVDTAHGFGTDLRRRQFWLYACAFALLAGQSLASLHSILESAVPGIRLPHPPGAVTESGQLVLVFSLALFLVLVPRRSATSRSEPLHFADLILWTGRFFLLLVVCWPDAIVSFLPAASLWIAQTGAALAFAVISLPRATATCARLARR